MEFNNKSLEFASLAPYAQEVYKNNQLLGFPVQEYQFRTLNSVLEDHKLHNREYYFLRDNIKGNEAHPDNIIFMGIPVNGCILEFESINLFIRLASIGSYRLSMKDVNNFVDGSILINFINSVAIYYEAFAYGNIKPDNLNRKQVEIAIKLVKDLLENPKSVESKLHFVVDGVLDSIYSQWMDLNNKGVNSITGHEVMFTPQQAKYRYSTKKE